MSNNEHVRRCDCKSGLAACVFYRNRARDQSVLVARSTRVLHWKQIGFNTVPWHEYQPAFKKCSRCRTATASPTLWPRRWRRLAARVHPPRAAISPTPPEQNVTALLPKALRGLLQNPMHVTAGLAGALEGRKIATGHLLEGQHATWGKHRKYSWGESAASKRKSGCCCCCCIISWLILNNYFELLQEYMSLCLPAQRSRRTERSSARILPASLVSSSRKP